MARSKRTLPDPGQSLAGLRKFIKENQFQPVDFGLDTLVDMLRKGFIEVNPEFQRRHRWDQKKNSRLIESFLLSMPVPPIYIINREGSDKFDVIDGQQRLNAIRDFYDGKFRLRYLNRWQEMNGLNYRDLQAIGLASHLGIRPLRTFELRSSDPDVVYDVFSRLNTGGVELNDQELRNCTYARYEFNNLIKELGENETFWKLIGIKNHKDKKWKKMDNCKLVLRYFAVRGEGYLRFAHHIDPFLNDEMKERRLLTADGIAAFRRDFIRTVESVNLALGKIAFRNPSRPRSFMASLYDATMHAFDDMDPKDATRHREKLVSEYKGLWEDPDFIELFSKGTNTREKLAARIRYLDEMVARAKKE